MFYLPMLGSVTECVCVYVCMRVCACVWSPLCWRQHFVFDICYSYEMPDQNDTHAILPVYLWESSPKLGFSHEQLFGDPLLIAAPRRGCTYDTLYQLVLHRLQRNLRMPDDNSSWWNTKRISNGGKHFFYFIQIGIWVTIFIDHILHIVSLSFALILFFLLVM